MQEIRAKSAVLDTPDGAQELACDAVLVCAGGILPTPFLREIGVAIETMHGAA